MREARHERPVAAREADGKRAVEESWNRPRGRRGMKRRRIERARELEEMARSRLFGGEWMLASLSMDHLPFLI